MLTSARVIFGSDVTSAALYFTNETSFGVDALQVCWTADCTKRTFVNIWEKTKNSELKRFIERTAGEHFSSSEPYLHMNNIIFL